MISFLMARTMALTIGWFFIFVHDDSYGLWVYLGIPLALIGLTLIAEMINNATFIILDKFNILKIRG